MRNLIIGLFIGIVAISIAYAAHQPFMAKGGIIVEDASGDCWKWTPDDTTGAVIAASEPCP